MDYGSQKLKADIYHALIMKDKSAVLGLLVKADDGPMHKVTIHNDSVLHVALYTRQTDLVDELMLKMMSADTKLMTRTNNLGNTVIHEAATHDDFLSTARKMLELQPQLLTTRDKNGETPLFRAARYGQMETFKLLDDELEKALGEQTARHFRKKDDGSTVLHAAIDAEHFELAFWIAQKHEILHDKRNYEGLTALQLLACNPLAFQFPGKGWLKTFIDYGKVKSGFSVPWWDEMVEKRKRYNAVVKLAKLLIKTDTSWEATKYVNTEDASESEDEGDAQNSELKKTEAEVKKIEAHMMKTDKDELKKIEAGKKKAERQQTPLLLATQTGCFEIVDKILRRYPQAVEHIDREGRNILHIAIEYRQMEIFDTVMKRMEVPFGRLMRQCDKSGNSILHMVGKSERGENVARTGKRGPFFQLQDDLLLFERIQKVITPHFYKHTNKEGHTAEALLARNNTDLWKNSHEWLKRTADNCSIVAVLIATVAFAAAYTVPGGSNPNGLPVLHSQTFFIIFTICDVLSLTFCLTAVIIFLWILTSSYQLEEFKQALPQKLMLGITCLLFSVTMMMLAFSATIILLIRNNEQWTRIALYTAALLPVTVLATVYMHLYSALMKTLMYTFRKIGSYFLWSNCKKKPNGHAPVGDTNASSTTVENFPFCCLKC